MGIIEVKKSKNRRNNIELSKRFMHCLNEISKCENLIY